MPYIKRRSSTTQIFYIMKHIFSACYLLILLTSCLDTSELNDVDKEKISKEVSMMFDLYHSAISREGLVGEFDYLDDSEDFFWVPPGYTSPLDFDSVKTILSSVIF